MASNDLHPRERANNSDITDFGCIAGAIDQAEATAWDRIGGPTDDDFAAIGRLERRLYTFRPSGADEWRWLAGRLARAVTNGWSEEATGPLVALAS